MNGRELAVTALLRMEEGGYSNLVLDAVLKRTECDKKDKAFCTAIFYSVLEHRNTLDYILNPYLKKKISGLDAEVRAILRSGLAQQLYLNVPPSAAVNEAVKLTKKFRKTSASGLANAVLRKAGAANPDELHFNTLKDSLVYGCSVSEEIADHFLRYYPEKAQAVLQAGSAEKATAIRVNTIKTNAADLAELLRGEGCTAERDPVIENCLSVIFPGSPAETKAFSQGLFHVIGKPSQLAALSLQAQPGNKTVDLCAAPGGKSLVLAQQMRDTGSLYSCDVSDNRVSLLQKAMRRMEISCAKAVCGDASAYNPLLAEADRILADVPCSGLGIIGKKPDIRYKKLDGLNDLTALQAAILENAARCLKKGGRLVYSTCTLNPNENELQIKAFLSRHPEFAVASPHVLPHGFCDTGYGWLSIPCDTGMDGFFICPMEKT